MSAPSHILIFAPDAFDDLIDIQVYIEACYGAEQWIIYRHKLDHAFSTLALYPYSGSSRPELAEGIRVFPVEQHRIFYKLAADGVHIARILHARMDVRRYF